MNKELQIINQNGQLLVDSRDVAQMVGKEHKILMRDIRTYIGYLEKSKIGTDLHPSNFFIESTYLDSYTREKPCYLLTKKGCDMVANKLTGKKGILFTATYVTKFEEMENELKNHQLQLSKKQLLQLELFSGDDLKVANAHKQLLLLETAPLIEKIKENEPKVEYHDKVLHSDKMLSTTDIAKDLGMSAIKLNRILNSLKVIFKPKGKSRYITYAEYDYLITDKYADYIIDEYGQQLKWTEKGRKFIIDLLLEKDYLER